MLPQLDNILGLSLKLSFMLAAGLYLIFAFIVVKQVSMMTRNVYDKFNGVLKLFSWAHLAAAGFLVFLTLVIL